MASSAPYPGDAAGSTASKLWAFLGLLRTAYQRYWGGESTTFFKLGDVQAPFTFNRDQSAVACITLMACGVPTRLTSSLTGWSSQHAKRLYAEWKRSGKIAKAHGGGRRPAMTEEQCLEVVSALRATKVHSLSDVIPAGVKAHPSTVARHIRQAKGVTSAIFKRRTQGKKPFSLTRKHKQARVDWATRMIMRAKHRGREAYVKLLSFTDSKIFLTAELLPQGEWVIKLHSDEREEEEAPSTRKSHYKVHGYGGLTFFGLTTLHTHVSGTRSRVVGGAAGKKGVDAKEYQENILPVLLKELAAIFKRKGLEHSWVFQQDGAPAHTTANTPLGKRAREIIDALAPSCIWDWPSLSPDLSLIENVWAEVVRRMQCARRTYANHDQFESHIKEVWAQISDDKTYLHSLYFGGKGKAGFLDRLQECIDRKGGKTPH